MNQLPAIPKGPGGPGSDGGFSEDGSDRAPGRDCVTPDSNTKTQYLSLRSKISNRVHSTEVMTTDLADTLEKVRLAYKQQLELLKSLEMERIDLEAGAQWFESMRANWKSQHTMYGIQPAGELDKKLLGETQGTKLEAKQIANYAAEVSAQINRLRLCKNCLERQLSERKARLFQESSLLKHCEGSIAAISKRMAWTQSISTQAPGRRKSVEPAILTHRGRRPPGKRASDFNAFALSGSQPFTAR